MHPIYEKVITTTPETTLRDSFAKAALTGLLSGAHCHSTPGIYAIHAYKQADAMLAEREKKNE